MSIKILGVTSQGAAALGTAGWPVVGGNVARATTTWTSATAVGTVLAVSITGYSSVLVTLNQGTTITAGGVIFEGSDDGGITWYLLLGMNLTNFNTATGYGFVASTLQGFVFAVGGWSNFRVRLNSAILGTGSVTVGISTQAISNAQFTTISATGQRGVGIGGQLLQMGGRRSSNGFLGDLTLIDLPDTTNLSLLVVGPFSDNSVNTSQKLSTLSARANAAAPSWTEGNQAPLSVDLAGSLRIIGVISSKTALTASSPTVATVGVASAQAVASNTNRKGLVLVNTSVNTISIAFGATAVLNSGITLQPGGTFEMDEWIFSTAAINAIASAASSNLAIQEFTT